jgi:hypothetical protein
MDDHVTKPINRADLAAAIYRNPASWWDKPPGLSIGVWPFSGGCAAWVGHALACHPSASSDTLHCAPEERLYLAPRYD